MYSGKPLFANSITENESRAVLSDIGDQTNKRAEPECVNLQREGGMNLQREGGQVKSPKVPESKLYS